MKIKLRILIAFLCLFLVGLARAEDPVSAVPFEMVENMVFLPVRVNGSEPLWFVLDSGASGCVIELQYAKKLGLPTEGGKKIGGAGAGKTEVTFTPNVMFRLPAVDLPVQKTMVIDFKAFSSKVGHELAGLLGYDFFARYIVSIDYDSRILRLYEPEKYHYEGKGEVLPIQLRKNLPYMRVRLKVPGAEEQDVEVLIDSGSSDAIDSDVIALSKGNKTEAIGGIGLGQPFHITLGKYETVQIGNQILRNVNGATGAKLMGGEILHRFHVIFDYTRSRIILQPNRHLKDESLFNLSGLDIESSQEPRGFRVAGVLKDFPAAKQGIQQDDLITKIEGQPAANFSFENLMRLLHQPNSQFSLTIQHRNEKERTVHFKLPDQPPTKD